VPDLCSNEVELGYQCVWAHSIDVRLLLSSTNPRSCALHPCRRPTADCPAQGNRRKPRIKCPSHGGRFEHVVAPRCQVEIEAP
jgi:hypothetical protein